MLSIDTTAFIVAPHAIKVLQSAGYRRGMPWPATLLEHRTSYRRTFLVALYF